MTQDDHFNPHDACGVLERQADLVEIRGADRTRFLNGYVTCDVKELRPLEGTYGFVTEVKGHVLADVRVLALTESFWLELPARLAADVTAHLGKYVLFDQVEIEHLDGWTALSLVGRGGVGSDVFDVELSSPYAHAAVDIAGTSCRLVREPDLGGVPLRTLWTPSKDAEAVRQELTEQGVRSVDLHVFQRLRVEAGRPLYGQDFGRDNFPQETGIDGAVSYEKGCYLGQEVVARIHYRGGVNRLLRGLVFAGDPASALGRDVLDGGRPAGRVTSAVRSERYGAIGLAVLHKRVEPGAEVELDGGGGTARVVELPFG